MKILDFISELQEIEKVHGNIDIFKLPESYEDPELFEPTLNVCILKDTKYYHLKLEKGCKCMSCYEKEKLSERIVVID